MGTSLWNFNEVEAQRASSATLLDMIADVLRHDDGQCYEAMEQFLLDPGVSGNRQFDQCRAVEMLIKYDSKHEGRLDLYMKDHPTFRHKHLWDKLVIVLRRAGFIFEHGRLTGVRELEDQPAKKAA